MDDDRACQRGDAVPVIVQRHRAGPVVLVLAIALVTACSGSTAPSGAGAGSSPPATAGSSAPIDRPSATPGGPSAIPGGVDVPLPEPTLVDPVEIGAALWDPERVDQGVVSLIAALGIAIDTDTGEPLRPGSGAALADFHLTEAEVRGLIEMGTADAAAVLEHAGTTTLGDLSSALAGIVPGMSEDQILGAYVAALPPGPRRPRPPSRSAGHAFVKEAAVHAGPLWLLLAPGWRGRARFSPRARA